MAGFCTKCGAPLGAGKFCTGCGAPIPASASASPSAPSPVAAAPAAAPAAYPATAPPAKSSSTMKVLLIVFGALALFFMVAMGSCFYVGYRIRQKARQFTQESANIPAYRGTRDACKLVTAADVSEALGVPAQVAHSSSSNVCQFKFGEGGAKTLAVDFSWEGGAMTMKLSRAAMGQFGGIKTFTPLQGVGDEAYVLPAGSGLMMRKGDVMVHIDLRMADLNVDAAKILAAKIADRI